MTEDAANSLAGKRVLIAEDSLAQQRFFSFVLTKAQMSVTLVENGQEAIERASRESFDVILLDMQMPVVDGYEAATQVRRQGYRGPIVALTADTFAGDQERCLQAGCDAYLAKPVQPEDLLGLITRLLGLASATPEQALSAEDATFQDLASEYTSALAGQMQELRNALTANNRLLLAQLAHKMRGAAAMYGFADLAETAGLLEDAVRENQEDTLLQELLGEMVEEARGLGTR